ncbi:PTS mannose/fructose/sorbose/N-acetylgalactosamine transporter subunit IIC [Lactiplantibacillus carotarum]|uniref:PTS mannose/fructose/sorbose/N-acetylgalactosamine transporter subunit IIC n=1 Tax=Lactiplantibacillus carotarum TaxID=2993456 RepID=UPI00298F05A2|nr:PTS sugar transporter subunit IIC [Lactiplantibacillus carotarum]
MHFTIMQAALVGIWAAFCYSGQLWGIYTNRALFISFGIGLILGDLKTAVVFGATAELAFMGFGVGPGGSTPPNPLGPGIVGTILAISVAKLSPAAALALSYPFAIIVPVFMNIVSTLNASNMGWAKTAIEGGHYQRFKFIANIQLYCYAIFAFLLAFTATVSTNALRDFVNAIPQWLIQGFSVAGELLPAVGFALIMSTMLKKEYLPAIILGYVGVAYLKMPVIGLTFLGIILALNNYYQKRKNNNNHNDNDGTTVEDGGAEDGI